MRVKIPGMSAYVDEFKVDVTDFEKRLRVFAGPQILRNDKLTVGTKLNSYFRLSKSAIKHKRLDVFAEAASIWFDYLLEDAEDDEDDYTEDEAWISYLLGEIPEDDL